MHKIQTLVLSFIISISSCAWGAEQLTCDERELKELLQGACGVYVLLEEGVEIVPLLDDDLQDVCEDYLSQANALIKKGVTLPKSHCTEIAEYKNKLTQEIRMAKEAC